MRKKTVSVCILLACILTLLFPAAGACAAEGTETAQNGSGLNWEIKQSDNGYYLQSSYIQGTGYSVSKGSENRVIILYIDKDVISFKIYSNADGRSRMTNDESGRDMVLPILFSTGSGVEGIAHGILPQYSSEVSFSSDELVPGITASAFLLSQLAAGETVDLWIPVYEWNSRAVEGYGICSFTLCSKDSTFAELLEKARQENWGCPAGDSAPFESAFTEDVNSWGTVPLYDVDAVQLMKERIGFTLFDDFGAEAVKVYSYLDRYGFSFELGRFLGGAWTTLWNQNGEEIQFDIDVSLDQGDYIHTTAVLPTGSSKIYISDTEIADEVLNTLLRSGCVTFRLYLSLPRGSEFAPAIVSFTLPEYNSNAASLYAKQQETDWQYEAPFEEVIQEQGYKWVKQHEEDGTMVLQTGTCLPGTAEYPDGTSEPAGVVLCQSYRGFFLYLFDSAGYHLENTGTDPLPITCRLIEFKGAATERTHVFQETVQPGNARIDLTISEEGFSAMALMQNALSRPNAYHLEVQMPNGSNYSFEIPKTDYWDIWELASDYWYIPTFNDEIYVGQDVNPDLAAFMEEFIPAATAVFEEAGDSDAVLAYSEYIHLLKRDGHLFSMFIFYNLMKENGLSREVDAAYFSQQAAPLEEKIAKQTVNDFWDLEKETLDGLSPFVHWLIGEEEGNTYDTYIDVIDRVVGLALN